MKDKKNPKTIMVRPSVVLLAKRLNSKYGYESFSDMVEKLIKEKANEQ